MEWTFSIGNINIVAKEFWQAIKEPAVIAFHGQMGAGKTTFIHALCGVKGVKSAVGSPTFSIINEYEYFCGGTKRILFHIDLYRLGSLEEVFRAGVEECLNSGDTCLVEWPEKAPGIFPHDAVHVFIEMVNDKTRHLKIANN